MFQTKETGENCHCTSIVHTKLRLISKTSSLPVFFLLPGYLVHIIKAIVHLPVLTHI